MPRQIITAGLHLRVTLEETATGSGASALIIPLRFPVSTVIGVWAAASEGGTNLYDDTCGHDGTQIKMGAGTVSASTTYYVSYNTEAHLPVIGFPADDHQGSIMAVFTSMPSKIESDPATNYERANPFDSGSLASYVLYRGIDPFTINQVEVVTDGTNIAVYLYDGATADYDNLVFRKTTINTYYNSSEDYADLKAPAEGGIIYLCIVDTGANATPANTVITIRGHAGI